MVIVSSNVIETVVRFCHEPLAREIEQPLSTFTIQNKVTLLMRRKIDVVTSSRMHNQLRRLVTDLSSFSIVFPMSK